MIPTDSLNSTGDPKSRWPGRWGELAASLGPPGLLKTREAKLLHQNTTTQTYYTPRPSLAMSAVYHNKLSPCGAARSKPQGQDEYMATGIFPKPQIVASV